MPQGTFVALGIHCMKTKSHKGQESRTRSRGPRAIDQEPRTKSQAYMHAWSQTKRLRSACRRLRCTHIYTIFFHSQHVSLRQRRSAGQQTIIGHSCRMFESWPKRKLPYKSIYNQKRKRGSCKLLLLFVLLLFAFLLVERIRYR